MVALGLGGVFTEVLKDVTYRVAPFGIETARDMIADLRAAKLFEGYRGKPAADKEALANALVAVSKHGGCARPRASRSSTSIQCSSAPPARAWWLPTR